MKTPNPQSPGPWESLVETAETTEKMEGGSNQQLKEMFIWNTTVISCAAQIYGLNRKITHKNLRQYRYLLVIQNTW